MPVESWTQISQTLDVGDAWGIGVLVTDDDGYASSATVTVQVTLPDGTTTTPAATEDPTGAYLAEHTLTLPGRHLAVVTVSGTVVGVVPSTVWAAEVTAGGVPDMSEVRAYLGDTSEDDATIADALAAETAAQRARCRIPAVYPADLAQALKRRVARNLAARAVPVASFTSFEGGGTSSRVPTRDAEISRLEGPYAKRVFG
jgi:hypothetical protein